MLSNLLREALRLIAGTILRKRLGARFIMVIGGPGAGKGTQSVLLAKLLGLPHLSTGDLIRRHLAAKTALGKEIEQYTSRINGGGLIPDELIMRILLDELKDSKYDRGAILDGFPRTSHRRRNSTGRWHGKAFEWRKSFSSTCLKRTSSTGFRCGERANLVGGRTIFGSIRPSRLIHATCLAAVNCISDPTTIPTQFGSVCGSTKGSQNPFVITTKPVVV